MVRVRLRKTAAGFGFTLADGKDGRQRVRQLLDVDNPQVAQLRVRDQLVAIEDILVHHLRHEQVGPRLRSCPAPCRPSALPMPCRFVCSPPLLLSHIN